MTVDEELSQLEESMRRLKIEYDVYFGGGAKKPPADTVWRVEQTLKKYSDGHKMNFAQRFRYNGLQQKYALFNGLWQQKLRIKEEGYRRPQDALLAIQGIRSVDDSDPEVAENGGAAHFSIVCSDVEEESSKVQALYDAMVAARKQFNAKGPAGTFESFQQFVKKKTEQLRKEYGSSVVEYAVEVEDGNVRL